MSDVIGFSDPNALPGVFQQAGGQDTSGANTDGYTLPWRMDTTTTDAQSSGELDHSWRTQHLMWNRGQMNNFLAPQEEARVTMGYFLRHDIPYHWALADAFTVCDRYHCSVLGHFDHVLPPTPPLGQTDEYIGTGPIGLGFRVPCVLVSPFTSGPLVCSDVFDHTSVIQLLEEKFAVRCPNISDWRRETAGNLVQAINFAATPSTAVPALPNGDQLAAAAASQSSLPTPEPPSPQVMPVQDSTPRRGRPSGPVEAAGEVPEIGLSALLPAAGLAAAAGVIALRTRTAR